MNLEEYNILQDTNVNETITGSHLSNQKDRTLIYGYDCNGDTIHVYLKSGVIYKVAYRIDKLEYRDLEEWMENQYYIPNKRIHVECCDLEFCRLLLSREGTYGTPITPDWSREPKQFYGKIMEDFR